MMLKHMDKQLRELISQRMPVVKMAEILKKDYSTIYNYCRDHGIELNLIRGRPRKCSEQVKTDTL